MRYILSTLGNFLLSQDWPLVPVHCVAGWYSPEQVLPEVLAPNWCCYGECLSLFRAQHSRWGGVWCSLRGHTAANLHLSIKTLPGYHCPIPALLALQQASSTSSQLTICGCGRLAADKSTFYTVTFGDFLRFWEEEMETWLAVGGAKGVTLRQQFQSFSFFKCERLPAC